MTATALTSRLPYRNWQGHHVDIHDGHITVAGHTYSPVEALDLAAHLGHAVALIGAQRAATGCPCTTHPNQTNPTKGA